MYGYHSLSYINCVMYLQYYLLEIECRLNGETIAKLRALRQATHCGCDVTAARVRVFFFDLPIRVFKRLKLKATHRGRKAGATRAPCGRDFACTMSDKPHI